MSEWQTFERFGSLEARPYKDGEDLAGISVSEPDKARASLVGGMIGRNPNNHADQWYIAPEYFEKNYRPLAAASTPADEPAQEPAPAADVPAGDATAEEPAAAASVG